MIINTESLFSMSQANQNFSKIAKSVTKHGEAIILKNSKPKYIVADVENNLFLDLTDDEKIEIVAKRVLNRYLPAFKELAK